MPNELPSIPHPTPGATWCLRARQIRIAGGTILDNAAVWGTGRRIAGVERWDHAQREAHVSPGSTVDLGEILLLPGLINAHAHLEYGFLRGVIPPGLAFCEWLDRVAGTARSVPPETLRDAATAGVRELRQEGCAFIADIVTAFQSPLAARDFPAHDEFRFYFEMIGFRDDEAAATVSHTLEKIEEMNIPAGRFGLSPHSPYTTTASLLQESARAAHARRIPLCIHCAETEEEVRFCRRGEGALRTFFDERGILPNGWKPPACSPVEVLDRLGVLVPRGHHSHPPVLLVHLNAATDDDLRLLSSRHVSAVVCPGTHQYFGRDRFPLERLLRAGVPVALGTDSLASNSRLSIWEEARTAARLCPALPVSKILDLVTVDASRALGLARAWGQIAPGFVAAFTPISTLLPAPLLDSTTAREWLFDPATRVGEAIFMGA